MNQFSGKAKIWIYPAQAAWHFISIPKAQTSTIKKQFEGLKRGWGSLKVLVTIGNTSWKTSIFPDNKTQTYLLPIKAEVRKKENLKAEQTIGYNIEILT